MASKEGAEWSFVLLPGGPTLDATGILDVMTATDNRILAALPPSELQLLEPHLRAMVLKAREVVAEPGDVDVPIGFVSRGLVSIVTVMQDDSAVESALLGTEGIIGLHAFLGAAESPTRAIVQFPGEALAIAPDKLRALLPRLPALQTSLVQYAELRLSMSYQLTACNRLHSVFQRCAFWLLQSHDRIGQDEFDLTHAFMATMLGVRRPSVSEAAHRLLTLGVVDYRHGHVRILERAGLEALACECDARLRNQRNAFLSRIAGLSPGGMSLVQSC